MKKIKDKSFIEEFMEFLRKDPVRAEDIVYEEPITNSEWNEIDKTYLSQRWESTILLKSGQKKRAKIKGIDQKIGFIELEGGENIPFNEIKELEKD